MLDLAPEIENTVRDYAAHEGVSIDELLARTFPPRPQSKVETPRASVERIKNLLIRWNAQHGLPAPPGGVRTLTELSAQWEAEDANLSEAERDAEREFWESRARDFDSRPPLAL